MTIRRAPKPPKFKAPKVEDTSHLNECVECGKLHDGGAPGTYMLPSLLDPTIYMCGHACYLTWRKKQPKLSDPVDQPTVKPVPHTQDGPGLFG